MSICQPCGTLVRPAKGSRQSTRGRWRGSAPGGCADLPAQGWSNRRSGRGCSRSDRRRPRHWQRPRAADLVRTDLGDEVELTRQEAGDARRRLGRRDELDGFGRSLRRPPIAVEGFEGHPLAQVKPSDAVGARAHGGGGKVGIALGGVERVGRDDLRGEAGEPVGDDRVVGLHSHADGHVVDDLHALDPAEEGHGIDRYGLIGAEAHGREGRDHIGRIERVAIVEGHAFAEREFGWSVLDRSVPGRRKARLQRAAIPIVRFDQRFEHAVP